MKFKLFEVRDRATCIVVVAIKVRTENENPLHGRMAWRYGYSPSSPSIILTRLSDPGCGAQNNPYDWRDRTMQTAHQYIYDNFEYLDDGQVVDVQVILGESTVPAESEFSRT